MVYDNIISKTIVNMIS